MSGVTTVAFRRELISQRFLGFVPEWNNFEIALTRKVPTTNSDVSQLDEPVGLAYARVQIAIVSSNFVLVNQQEVYNTGTLFFPTASGFWGTVHGWAIISQKLTAWSPGKGPEVMAVGTLQEPLKVVAGVRPKLGPGAIAFGLYDSA